MHSPGWGFAVMICPLEATKEIMAINVSPQVALHPSIPNALIHTYSTYYVLYLKHTHGNANELYPRAMPSDSVRLLS